MKTNNELVQVKNLTIGFSVEGMYFEAVDSLSFSMQNSESVGLVGESGCGKTITSMTLIKFLPSPPAVIKHGEVFFRGKEVLSMSPHEVRKIRGKEIGVTFKEPMKSFNPIKKIGCQVSEPLRIHFPGLRRNEIYEKSVSIMKETGLPDPERIYNSYPHMLSRGMMQRAVIAAAMVTKPLLLIADEPATTLDVTIRAQIIDLLKSLQDKYKMSILLITHNPGLAAEMCQRIIVMYAGRLTEIASNKSLFDSPLHPYTRGLLASIPLLSYDGLMMKSIPGSVLHPKDYLPGCRFMPRCERRMKKCKKNIHPPLFSIGHRHYVACWLYEKKAKDIL